MGFAVWNVKGKRLPIGVAIFLNRLKPMREITPLIGPFHGRLVELAHVCFFRRRVCHFVGDGTERGFRILFRKYRWENVFRAVFGFLFFVTWRQNEMAVLIPLRANIIGRSLMRKWVVGTSGDRRNIHIIVLPVQIEPRDMRVIVDRRVLLLSLR